MKPFNLEEAKVGKPVCTRNGRRVEIISFENPSNNNYPMSHLLQMRGLKRMKKERIWQRKVKQCPMANILFAIGRI